MRSNKQIALPPTSVRGGRCYEQRRQT